MLFQRTGVKTFRVLTPEKFLRYKIFRNLIKPMRWAKLKKLDWHNINRYVESKMNLKNRFLYEILSYGSKQTTKKGSL
jgi:hypothetical protein